MSQQFGEFTASELYCPKCRAAQPVRERLLLILPDGELRELLCARCATSLGKRTISTPVRPPTTMAGPRRRVPRRLLRG